MREITYKCDICKAKGNKDNIKPYFVNGNGELQFLEEIDNSDNHICDKCIVAVWEYKEDKENNKRVV